MTDCLSSYEYYVQTSGLLLVIESWKWILKKRDYKHRVWTELRIVPTGWLRHQGVEFSDSRSTELFN